MRKIFVIAVIALLAAPAFADAIIQSGAYLKVELAKYDPFPAEAGKFVNVWFKVENRGADAAKNTQFILETAYPLSIPDNNSVRNYGQISPGDDILLEYKLLVDKGAPKDDAELILKYNFGGPGFFEKNFTITIGTESNRAELKALYVSAEPSPVPSGMTTLTVDIINRDKGTAYFTVVKAESEAAVIERNELFIGTLEPDDFDSADFELAMKDVEPGEYPADIIMNYKDEDSNEFETKSTVMINVISLEDSLDKENTPAWMYVLYVIAIIIIIRLAIPFMHWVIKPAKKIVRRNKEKG